MATIHFVDANNNIGQVFSFSNHVGPFCIAICDQNGTTHYIPTDGAGYSSYDEYNSNGLIYKYYYSPNSPSLHALTAGGEILNAYNAVSVTSWGIPEGTYTPQAFEDLIQDFIPLNSGRWAKVGGGLFKVNNQVQQIVNEEGKCYIYYGSTSSGSGLSSGEYRFVAFNTSNLKFPEAQDITNFRGIYIVKGTSPFQQYSNFPITMFGGTGIQFV